MCDGMEIGVFVGVFCIVGGIDLEDWFVVWIGLVDYWL